MQPEVADAGPAAGHAVSGSSGWVGRNARHLQPLEQPVGSGGEPRRMSWLAGDRAGVSRPHTIEEATYDSYVEDQRRRKLHEDRTSLLSKAGSLFQKALQRHTRPTQFLPVRDRPRQLDGELKSAEPGTGLVVAKARVPVIPMRLFGAYEALPTGSGRFRTNTVTAVVGEPIRYDREELPQGKDGFQQISDRIMAAIAALECPPDRIPHPRPPD